MNCKTESYFLIVQHIDCNIQHRVQLLMLANACNRLLMCDVLSVSLLKSITFSKEGGGWKVGGTVTRLGGGGGGHGPRMPPLGAGPDTAWWAAFGPRVENHCSSVKINMVDCVRLTQGRVSANTTVSMKSHFTDSANSLLWDTAYDLWGLKKGAGGLLLFFFKIYFWCFCLLLWYDSGKQTGSEVGEREWGRMGKGPRSGILTRDTRSVTALYVGTLAHKAIGQEQVDFYHYRVVVYTHCQHTFMLKKHVKVNFA